MTESAGRKRGGRKTVGIKIGCKGCEGGEKTGVNQEGEGGRDACTTTITG